MRLLARLHRRTASDTAHERSGGTGLPRRSLLIGVITSGVVIAHLGALGIGGALLFLRYGTGYSNGQTIGLAVMVLIAIVAFGRAGSQLMRRRRYSVGGEGR